MNKILGKIKNGLSKAFMLVAAVGMFALGSCAPDLQGRMEKEGSYKRVVLYDAEGKITDYKDFATENGYIRDPESHLWYISAEGVEKVVQYDNPSEEKQAEIEEACICKDKKKIKELSRYPSGPKYQP